METFTLLQWNIWYKENPQNIKDLLLQVSPDIASFQEVTINYETTEGLHVPNFLEKNSGYTCIFEMAQYWPTNNGDSILGNAILSKHQIKTIKSVHINPINTTDFEDYSKEGRVTIFASVAIGEKNITIATTHMSYIDRFKETSNKLEEENNLLKAIKGYDNKFILTGDFNADENSYLVEKLQELLIHAGPDFSTKTWTTKPFNYQGFIENDLKWRLDYVFCSSDIRVLNAKVLETDFSDHLPILVTFEIMS